MAKTSVRQSVNDFTVKTFYPNPKDPTNFIVDSSEIRCFIFSILLAKPKLLCFRRPGRSLTAGVTRSQPPSERRAPPRPFEARCTASLAYPGSLGMLNLPRHPSEEASPGAYRQGMPNPWLSGICLGHNSYLDVYLEWAIHSPLWFWACRLTIKDVQKGEGELT